MENIKISIEFSVQDIINKLQFEYNMSDYDIATELAVSTRSVYRWKIGESKPTQRIVKFALSNLLKEKINKYVLV